MFVEEIIQMTRTKLTESERAEFKILLEMNPRRERIKGGQTRDRKKTRQDLRRKMRNMMKNICGK
jgi:hypothetical protein